MKNKFSFVLLLVLTLITISCGNINDESNGVFDGETGSTVTSQNIIILQDAKSISSVNKQILDDKTFEYNIINSSEIKFEDLSLIGEDIYQSISGLVNNIDYHGDFESKDILYNDIILEKFYKVVIGEDKFINFSKEKGYYEGEFDSINANECIYYYFDMDSDEIPEMIVSDNVRYEYLFKYDAISKEVLLIHIMLTTSQLLGDNKISFWQGGTGLTYGYYELDDKGERESEIRFYSTDFFNNKKQQEDEVYLVGFPEDSKEIELLKGLPINGEVEAYFDEITETHYFRVTEEEYRKITMNYFQSREEAEKNIKEVTYTFEELFGEKFE